MQKLGDIESLTGQGFRSRSIAHSSIGSHRDESRRLSRLTPPHHASHEVRDVDCRRPEHATGGPVLPLAVPEYKPHEQERTGRAGTRAGAERLSQPVLPHRCCPTIPAPRQACTEPPAPRRRAPSRAAAPTAYRAVLRRPVCVRKPAGEVCPDTAHGMRQLGACCRTPSPLQGTSMGPAPAGGADPDRSASVCDRKATTCGHWRPLVTYSLRSGPAV